VKTRFQSFAFKCNLHRYTMVHHILPAAEGGAGPDVALHVCQLAGNLRGDAGKDVAEVGTLCKLKCS
jgi:hypothetical protein